MGVVDCAVTYSTLKTISNLEVTHTPGNVVPNLCASGTALQSRQAKPF